MQSSFFLVVIIHSIFLMPGTEQLQSSQTQVLQQLRKQLEFPTQLDSWNDTKDLCYVPSSPAMTVSCEGNLVTELKIVGDKLVKLKKFDGYAVPGHTLSQAFSIDSFATTLSRLPSLRVLILSSLGIWGALPDKIHRLDSLEVLDLTSNFLYGFVPPKISTMKRLQTLTLDGNYFNGTVADWFYLMPNLTVLSLQRNQFTGSLPQSLGKVKTLTDLALSSNSLSGEIPDLSGLTSLNVLDLRDNKLDSELPDVPKGLATILLNKNSLKGEILNQYGELERLQHLDLSVNFLEGTPPSALFSLPNMSYLNLASNMLSGSLPSDINCGSQLGFVDISANRLTGVLPSCLSSSSNNIVIKFDGNCFNVDPQNQHEVACSQEIHKEESSKNKDIGLLVVLIGVTMVLLLVLLGLLAFCRRNCQHAIAQQFLLKKPAPKNLPSGFSTELLANATMKLGKQVLPTYRVFSLKELQDATKNFDRSSFVGEGSMGKDRQCYNEHVTQQRSPTQVNLTIKKISIMIDLYKGRLENGNFVAIRCLALFMRYPIRNLKLRLDLLSKLQHPHLVCLLGHCIDSAPDDSGINRIFLVYEYVPNGNLHRHLSEHSLEKIFKWSDRLAVLISIAKAVQFLQTGVIPGFFNNRLKTNNILLDEHWVAKLSDYGLSIITEEIERYEARMQGQRSAQNTFPESDMIKLEDDVYCFGFILLEVLVGPAISEKEACFLSKLATPSNRKDDRERIIDPIVLGTSSQESLSIVISITNKCLSPEPSTRPSIEDVLWNLQYAAQVQATADGDQRSEVGSQA